LCKRLVLYIVSQKTRHQTLVHFFAKYWPIFRIISLLHPAGNLRQKVITDPTTPKRCRYITLRNITLQKMRRPSTATADQACAYWWECNRDRWTGILTKPIRPATNSSLNTWSSTIGYRADHLFSPRSWFKVFKETPAGELIEANDSNAQNSCWMIFCLYSFQWCNAIHISYTENFTERPTVSICCKKRTRKCALV